MVHELDWVRAKGQELIRDGRQAFNRSKSLEICKGEHESAEALARSSLKTLRSAMNWTEDTPNFEQAHQLLDKAGRYVRTTFGCHLLYEDRTYFQTCPVALAHNRIGFSTGLVARKMECSISKKDPEDCPHVTGRFYAGEMCVRRVIDGEILEVSIVDRPRQPDTRIEKIGLNTEKLRRSLPEGWEPGTPVNCDRCLTQCDGVVDHQFGSHGKVTNDSSLRRGNGPKFEGVVAIESDV
jgi:hypothetical protein